MANGSGSLYVGRCGLCEEPLYEDDDTVVVEGERCHRECAEAEDYKEFGSDYA